MKKTIVLLALGLFFCGLAASAQGISLSGDLGNTSTAVKKIMFDTAQVKLFYSLKFKKDSTRNDTTEAQTVLLIGKTHTLFLDYYNLVLDSIYDDADKTKKNPLLIMPKCFELFAVRKFEMYILSDLHNDTTIVREDAFVNTYEYKERTPVIDWNILPEDSVINGLPCGKATCHFRGRDYVAWYLKDVPLPYGPYRFNGLPGLIAVIKDTKGNFCFTLNGAQEKPRYTNLIYLHDQSIFFTRTTREKARQAIKTTYEHKADIMLQDPIIKISPDAAKKMDRSPDPYNPIELE